MLKYLHFHGAHFPPLHVNLIGQCVLVPVFFPPPFSVTHSGAQGEFAGLCAIMAYHRDRGEQHRKVGIYPSSIPPHTNHTPSHKPHSPHTPTHPLTPTTLSHIPSHTHHTHHRPLPSSHPPHSLTSPHTPTTHHHRPLHPLTPTTPTAPTHTPTTHPHTLPHAHIIYTSNSTPL